MTSIIFLIHYKLGSSVVTYEERKFLWVVQEVEEIGENAFQLNMFPFLGLHLVFNVYFLRPYFPPFLEHIELYPKDLEDI
jgi:hypothetical protein